LDDVEDLLEAEVKELVRFSLEVVIAYENAIV
jgi:hypothetical protein